MLYLREQGCKVLWLCFEAKTGPREGGGIRKHCSSASSGSIKVGEYLDQLTDS